MAELDPYLIDPPKVFSQSHLWKIQKNYFDLKGVSAWDGEVPFYISSNTHNAFSYALFVINFIKDKMVNLESDATFNIIELGAGTGKFSFYFLKSFSSLLKSYKLDAIKFRYLITDVTQKNLDFCKQNLKLKPYIDKEQVDFAKFDVTTDDDFELQIADTKLSVGAQTSQFVIIANYTFDCIKQDAFVYDKEQWHELLVGLKSRFKNFDINKCENLKEVLINFERKGISIDDYYQDKNFSHVLKKCAQHIDRALEKQQIEEEKAKESTKKVRSISRLGFAGIKPLTQMVKEKKAKEKKQIPAKDIHLLIPTASFDFVNRMKKLTHDNFIMIVGDKGIAKSRNLSLLNRDYMISYDGCYSLSYNFVALREYIEHLGGDSLLTENLNSFKVCLYSIGQNFSSLTNTKAYFKEQLEYLGPDEYTDIASEFHSSNYRFALKSIMSLLRFSHFDPDNYCACHERIIELVKELSLGSKKELISILEKVESNIYYFSGHKNVFNLLGIFYLAIDEHEKAIELFEKDIEVFGSRAIPHHNAGLVFEALGNTERALYHFHKALEGDKDNKFAKKMVRRLNASPFLLSAMPLIKSLIVFVVTLILIYFLVTMPF